MMRGTAAATLNPLESPSASMRACQGIVRILQDYSNWTPMRIRAFCAGLLVSLCGVVFQCFLTVLLHRKCN